MSEAIKPTPGLWHTQPPNLDDDEHSSDRRRYTWRVRTAYEPNGNACIGHEVCEISHINTGHEESDARLIADAGNVFHETGLTPRQLVEQRDALVTALEGCSQDLRDVTNHFHVHPESVIGKNLAKARAALALVKGAKP